ncbi:hypothetical protein [Paracoccus sulfuroxidans]|uniref:Uncharacterized protein n=1 Tax=Paracoccus sulfuroxidans TaxID=384678 RepID=A0A562NRU8_9RHOB|nr:hypothetical protein [Paracoccus sulfuroxidans]TWI34918.1 hypothetical protein IQ24_01426 [Paracoccus sulfuroxidans]
MEWRNPRFNASGTIDVELLVPDLGWLPFTASPDDPEDYGRAIFNDLKDKAAPFVPEDQAAE